MNFQDIIGLFEY